MQGKKTHEQQLRTLERKSDVPKPNELEIPESTSHQPRSGIRESEFAVSRRGMHQESRDHNKHNHDRQEGHKPQDPQPSQEKQ